LPLAITGKPQNPIGEVKTIGMDLPEIIVPLGMAMKLPSRRRKSKPYLTKRILVRAARSGVKTAAEETMKVMGHVIIVENGWVVQKDSDGNTIQITPIDQPDSPALTLD
jgi:hypothetical protein